MPKPPRFESELPMFHWTWQNRPHFSEISGDPLGDTMMSYYFAHCLPKSLSKRFRLQPINIILMTWEEHQLYDLHTFKASKDPRFNWVFKLRYHLKELDNKFPIK